MTAPTDRLAAAGVSIWLDDLSRSRLTSGNLAELMVTRKVTGVTTNPTIFAAALRDGTEYAGQLARLVGAGATVDEAILALTTDDVRAAADVLRPVYEATGGIDGRVSIEVSPELAHDTAGTIAQARQLWAVVDRPNVMIKIPATPAGLPAITEMIGSGISVNATLIFALARYGEVIDAYLAGLRQARDAGRDLSTIHSVASFFVSRVDREVDARLARIGSLEALALRGSAAVANARLAYRLFGDAFAGAQAAGLIAAGANVQRPLWASTGVKDAALPDTLYVTELVAARTVNTMPEQTLEAFHDHGEVSGETIPGSYADAFAVLEELSMVGVDLAAVTRLLEEQGIESFVASWRELERSVATALQGAAAV